MEFKSAIINMFEDATLNHAILTFTGVPSDYQIILRWDKFTEFLSNPTKDKAMEFLHEEIGG